MMINNLLSFLLRYIYFFGITVSLSTVSELFCGEPREIFVILVAILLPIKSPVASAAFLIALFEAFLSASVADFLA